MARLLKGLNVDPSVSDGCHGVVLRLTEALAICYADTLPPQNEITISVLLVHALRVISRGAPRGHATTQHQRQALREAANSARAAAAFLTANGSALTERLLDLFHKWAETGGEAALQRSAHRLERNKEASSAAGGGGGGGGGGSGGGVVVGALPPRRRLRPPTGVRAAAAAAAAAAVARRPRAAHAASDAAIFAERF